jgi:hypothetical protein
MRARLFTYSNRLRPPPTDSYVSILQPLLSNANSRNKLLNLTGFFSSVGGPLRDMVGTPVAGVELILWDSLVEDMGPDQGKRVLRRKEE